MQVSTLASLATLMALVCAPLSAATVYQRSGPGTVYDPPQTQVSVTQAQVQTTPASITHGPGGVQVTPARAVYTAPQITVSDVDRRRSNNRQQVVNHTTYTWNDSHTTTTRHPVQQHGHQQRGHQHSHQQQRGHHSHHRGHHQRGHSHHQRSSNRHYHRGYRHGYNHGYHDGYHDGRRHSRVIVRPRCGISFPAPRASITLNFGR